MKKETDINDFGRHGAFTGNCELKTNGTIHTNCTLFGKVVWIWVNSETLYIYTQVEQISKQIADGGNQASHFGVGNYRKARSGTFERTSGIGLESKISLWTHTSFNIDEQIQK